MIQVNSADTHNTQIRREDNNSKKTKGRTGWPQHEWALQLKQEQLS